MKTSKIFSEEWTISILIAAGLHFFIFFGSSLAFVQAPQYGIEASSGGIEVSLIAALPATAVKDSAAAEKEKQKTIKNGEDIIEEAEKKQEQKAITDSNAQKKNYTFINDTPYAGDGSSPVPGQSSTTFYSPGGGTTSEKEGYLKNPPPPYPQEAVRKGQEGLVLLTAHVDKIGRPSKVEVKTSSGFRLLDEAALKAVRRWKFDPARMGFLSVDSKIDIPIRFDIEEYKKSQ